MTLEKSDLQKFFKRLRKLNTQTKLKYYAVGEYGGKTNRPHYHIILFNSNENHVELSWALEKKPIGSIYIGNVQEASIGYTLKYLCKETKIPMHKNDDRNKEFAIMSKGLGANHLSESMIQWHRNDLENRMYIPIQDNKKIAMPRYYKHKIYSDLERQKIGKIISDKSEIEKDQFYATHGRGAENLKIEILKSKISKFKNLRLNEKM